VSRCNPDPGAAGINALDEIATAVTSDPQKGRPPQRDQPWWTVVLESALGLAAISALEIALWRFGEVATIELHLYWVFVLLQSLRRGLRLGLVVACLAAVAYAALAVAMPGAVPSSNERLGAESIFVLLVAIVTGDLREQWRGREAVLTARTGELSDALDDLAKRYVSASEVTAELGRRIAEQTVTVVTLDNIARRLEVFDQAEVFPALLQLLVLSLKVERASIYILEDGHLVRKAHVPAAEPALATDAVISDELVRQVLASREPRHIRDELAGRAGSGFATAPVLLAAPLLGSQGEPLGVVTVEQMAFLSFNRSAVRLFGILVAWASRSLQNALLFEEVSARGAQNHNGSVLKFPYPASMLMSSTGTGTRTDDDDGSRRPASRAAARVMRRRGVARLSLATLVTGYRWSGRRHSVERGVTRSASTDATQ
jgi:hypothetical protein